MVVGARDRNLAAVLPVRGTGPVVDLGCGGGQTLRALRQRLGAEVKLVGVERRPGALEEDLLAEVDVQSIAADLRAPLPFADATFAAVLCHNTLECLPDKQAFLGEVARILRPGAHLLLGHSDFDTMVFNASDLELTRELVHANADTQEAWMDASDGTIGRKLVAIARQSSLELVETFAWVTLETDFAQGSAAHTAVRSIAGTLRRDRHDELAARFDDWVEDLRAHAARGGSRTSRTRLRSSRRGRRRKPVGPRPRPSTSSMRMFEVRLAPRAECPLRRIRTDDLLC